MTNPYTPEKVAELIAVAETWVPNECAASPVGARHIIERLADALESTLAELRQERERADEAERYAEEFLEQRNEYIGFEKQAQDALSSAEETIARALDCLEENEDRDEVAIAILTEYDQQKEQA